MTLLDLSLLGLLADQPLHGYELKKRLGDLVDGRSSVSFGSLYPALSRLSREGLVHDADTPRSARLPMTGSLGAEVAAMRTPAHESVPRTRRTRKVYEISPAGQQRLVDLLAEPSDDDRTFAVQLAFGRHLSPEQRLALLERRRTTLTDRLAGHDDTNRFRDHYRRLARDRDQLAHESELVWLSHLIDEEQHLLEDAVSARPLPDPAVGGSPI